MHPPRGCQHTHTSMRQPGGVPQILWRTC